MQGIKKSFPQRITNQWCARSNQMILDQFAIHFAGVIMRYPPSCRCLGTPWLDSRPGHCWNRWHAGQSGRYTDSEPGPAGRVLGRGNHESSGCYLWSRYSGSGFSPLQSGSGGGVNDGILGCRGRCVGRGSLPNSSGSYLVQTTPAIGGAMISASHNPPADNGIKSYLRLLAINFARSTRLKLSRLCVSMHSVPVTGEQPYQDAVFAGLSYWLSIWII